MKPFIESNNNYINSNGEEFENMVQTILSIGGIKEIIETGTFNGLGSTLVFAKTKKPVITLESCYTHFLIAKENLKNFPNVTVEHASSVLIRDALKFIEEDDIYTSDLVKLKKIKIDNPSDDVNSSKNFYKNEIKGFNEKIPEKQNYLYHLIDNTKKQLVFLDSAGGVGYMEFLKFMSLPPIKLKNKVLMLDDISHVKHYRSVVWLKTNNFPVIISPNKRHAFCNFIE